jgi:hypothetical protein
MVERGDGPVERFSGDEHLPDIIVVGPGKSTDAPSPPNEEKSDTRACIDRDDTAVSSLS